MEKIEKNWWQKIAMIMMRGSIHTKGARAVPRWPPLHPQCSPFLYSSASSSPFSTSSPTRQTMLRTSEIMLRQNLVAFPKLTIIWWGSCRFYSSSLQTIRRSKNLWKRQMQLQKRVKSDKKERRETTETSFYEAETDRKRCKIGFTEHLEEL